MCDELTRAPASALKGKDFSGVQGYIDQEGRKVKFKKFSSLYEFGVYVGDEITGDAITYFLKPFKQIIEDSNPFSVDNSPLRRYKCDLDGKFRSLVEYEKASVLNKDQIKKIRSAILKGEPLV